MALRFKQNTVLNGELVQKGTIWGHLSPEEEAALCRQTPKVYEVVELPRDAGWEARIREADEIDRATRRPAAEPSTVDVRAAEALRATGEKLARLEAERGRLALQAISGEKGAGQRLAELERQIEAATLEHSRAQAAAGAVQAERERTRRAEAEAKIPDLVKCHAEAAQRADAAAQRVDAALAELAAAIVQWEPLGARERLAFGALDSALRTAGHRVEAGPGGRTLVSDGEVIATRPRQPQAGRQLRGVFVGKSLDELIAVARRGRYDETAATLPYTAGLVGALRAALKR